MRKSLLDFFFLRCLDSFFQPQPRIDTAAGFHLVLILNHILELPGVLNSGFGGGGVGWGGYCSPEREQRGLAMSVLGVGI